MEDKENGFRQDYILDKTCVMAIMKKEVKEMKESGFRVVGTKLEPKEFPIKVDECDFLYNKKEDAYIIGNAVYGKGYIDKIKRIFKAMGMSDYGFYVNKKKDNPILVTDGVFSIVLAPRVDTRGSGKIIFEAKDKLAGRWK